MVALPSSANPPIQPQVSNSSRDSHKRSNNPSIFKFLKRNDENVPVETVTNSLSATNLNDGIDIRQYCMGKPKKVAESHNKSIKVYVCLQEDALFLPTVKTRHPSRRRRRNHHEHSTTTPINDIYVGHDDENSDEEELSRPSETTTNQATETSTSVSAVSAESSTNSLTTSGVDVLGNGGLGSSDSGNQTQPSEHTPPTTSPPIDSQPPQNTTTQQVEDSIIQENNNNSSAALNDSCATLRGSVLVELSKPTKIKEIGVSFYCVSSTLWNLLPQSSLLKDHAYHNSAQVEDMAYLGVHHWDFVPLEQFGPAQASYDKVCGSQSGTLIGQDLYGADVAVLKSDPHTLQQREFTRLVNSSSSQVRHLETNNVPVFGPLRSQPRKMRQSSVNADGVMFPAGSYVYNFTLLVDAKTPGSVHLSNGQVKFAVAAKVHRAGPFTMNVSGSLGVDVVHIPTDFTEGGYSGPQNDQILVTRVWENMFMYHINLEKRGIALDVPTKLSVTLFPMEHADVAVHQIQVLIYEISTYIYSMDSTIKYVDPTLKLLLAQKTSKDKTSEMGLLNPMEPNKIDLDFVLVSEHNKNIDKIRSEAFKIGRQNVKQFLSPDNKGPYIRVKHRLQIIFKVSKPNEDKSKHGHRHFYDVKYETKVNVLSRHCVPDTISLPTYHSTQELLAYDNNDDNNDDELPPLPTFDDAMEHPLLSSGIKPASNMELK